MMEKAAYNGHRDPFILMKALVKGAEQEGV